MRGAAEFEAKLAALGTVAKVESAFEAEIARLGYKYFDYGSIDPALLGQPDRAFTFFSANYFRGDYLSYLPRNWPQGDPVFPAMQTLSAPFDYVAHVRSAPRTVTSSVQLSLLKLWNINQAWLVPLNTPGAIRFVTVYMQGDNRAEAFEATKPVVFLLAATMMDRIVALRAEAADAPAETVPPNLTREEQACLVLLTEGLSNPQIADRLGVSANTVRYHLKKVFRKLGVGTRAAAAARAKGLGLTR